MPRVTSPRKSTPRNRSVTSESSHGDDQPKGRKKFAAGKGLQAPEEDRRPKPTTSGKPPKPAKSHPRRTAHESELSSPLLVGNEPERIAKRLARAGLCSRREAERWIEERRVSVDGKLLDTPAVLVGPDSDILVDGEPIPEAVTPRLWRYHKPQGLVTSHGDPQGRPTVFDNLPPDLPRLISIGRLDLASEGLLLLTNSGGLSRHLELPATGWVRRYRVRVHGRVDVAKLESLQNGLVVEGVRYGPVEAILDRQQAGANAWITVSLTEGKNREVRKVMQHLGYTVNRLIRVAYGPFQLGTLKPGEVSPISANVLTDQLGAETALSLGMDVSRPRAGARKSGKGSARSNAPKKGPTLHKTSIGVGDKPAQHAPTRHAPARRTPGKRR